MKIAVVTWFINDVGGINSWTENFVWGLKQLGHTPQLFYGSHQSKLACHPTEKVMRSRRWHLLPSLHLSYRKDHVKASIHTLNKYDLIVFAHPSPHPTKSNTQAEEHARLWQLFYQKTTPRKIAVFHDRHWDRTNEWILEVRDSVDYVHAAQHHFIEAVSRFARNTISFGWGYFPLRILEALPSSSDKMRRIVMPTQWLSIKNHRYLLPRLLELKVPLHSYGSGQTYHVLMKHIQQVYHMDFHYGEPRIYNSKSRHIHYGHTEYHQMLAAMQKAWWSLDMSTQGMTNMTHWEPLSVGTLSIMEQRVSKDPYCEIPADCCLTFELDNVLEDLNAIAVMPRPKLEAIRQRAWSFIQRCEASQVAKTLLKEATR